jgi:IS30 family transposase
MAYQHLAIEERYTLERMSQEKYSVSAIAKTLGRHKSTISRELRRNKSQRGYRNKAAHGMALTRRKGKSKPKLDDAMKDRIEAKIKEKWSPEQISGRFKEVGVPVVSHQRIYEHVREDKAMGGELHKSLRRGNKRRRKRYGSKDSRGKIKDRVDIDQRPEVVALKTRVGDWEGDTIVGGEREGAVVTLTERKSKYLLMSKVDRACAEIVANAVIDSAKPHVDKFMTITYDNGREFAAHATVAAALGVAVFFAKPYHSWERGLNENTNGLIRQYIPKKAMLKDYSHDDIKAIQDDINHRPRKTLGYLTPHEVFIEGKAIQRKNVMLHLKV